MSASNQQFFKSARDTCNWAKERLSNFDQLCRAFFQKRPFRRDIEFDPKSGREIVKLKLTEALPSEVTLHAMEVIGHCKNAFDQATFAAVCSINGPQKGDIHFPWSMSQTDLEGKLQATHSTGNTRKAPFPPELWPILRSFEPYPRSDSYAGGDDVVRELAKLANKKHTINLTLGVSPSLVKYPSIVSNGYLRYTRLHTHKC